MRIALSVMHEAMCMSHAALNSCGWASASADMCPDMSPEQCLQVRSHRSLSCPSHQESQETRSHSTGICGVYRYNTMR